MGEWTHKRIMSEHEKEKEAIEKRKSIAEASGETLSEEQLTFPPLPIVGDDVWFPTKKHSLPGVSEKALAMSYAKFSLPSESEGFHKIEYVWLSKDKAEETLRQFVLKRKATVVVDGLQPGEWFNEKASAWKQFREKLQE